MALEATHGNRLRKRSTANPMISVADSQVALGDLINANGQFNRQRNRQFQHHPSNSICLTAQPAPLGEYFFHHGRDLSALLKEVAENGMTWKSGAKATVYIWFLRERERERDRGREGYQGNAYMYGFTSLKATLKTMYIYIYI